jgi:hypothetical protein
MTNSRFTRLALLLAAAAATLLAAGTPALAETPKNILFFGNSFTIGNGPAANGPVPTIVKNIAAAAGRPAPNVYSQMNGGWTLDNHITKINSDGASDVIRSSLPAGMTWDFAVMQEYSTKPTTHTADGNAADFRADALALFGKVRAHSPAATGVLFETWARGYGHAFYTSAPVQFPGGPAQMQQQLRTNYGLAAGDLNAANGAGSVRVAPVGDAFEQGNFSNLHNSDIYHANNRGSLLAGMAIYSTIYGDDVSDINLTGVATGLGLTAADATQLAGWSDAVTQVPEPGSLGLAAVAAAALTLCRRRK